MALRTASRIKWLLILSVLLLLACQLGVPGVQQATEPSVLPSLPPVTSALPTTAATSQPGLAPGTVIIDQTNPLSAAQGNKVELAFDAVAFQVISLDSTLVGGTLDYDLHLADKFGNFLAVLKSAPGVSTESLAEFTLPYEGTYRIILSPIEGDGNVQVVVTALASASGGGMMGSIGEGAGGMMSSPNVYHTYAFPLTQGDVVTIAARANVAGAPDTHLAFYGPDGRFISEADDLAPPTDLDAVVPGYEVPITGVYTAIVNNVGSPIGAYTFSVTSDTTPPESEGEPSIVYDSEYRADLIEGSNLNVTFDGAVGDVLRIEVFDPDPEVDVDMYLKSPFGQIISYAISPNKGEGTAINEVQLPYAGRYQLDLKPRGAGQASFRVNRLIAGATGGGIFGNELTKVLPGSFSQPNVFHVYQFNASAGDKISLVVYSVNREGQMDLGFALLGPNGRQLVFADDSISDNPPDPELVNYEVNQAGVFTVIVYSFTNATGTYELEYSRK